MESIRPFFSKSILKMFFFPFPKVGYIYIYIRSLEGRWFHIFFKIFNPILGKIPHLDAHIFQLGCLNHQPPAI